MIPNGDEKFSVILAYPFYLWRKVYVSSRYVLANPTAGSGSKLTFVADCESQNHKIVGVGRDLCGSSSPTPLPK